MNKKYAFTLSEVLIALAIIGVLAALLVPQLQSRYMQKSNDVMFNKTKVNLAQSLDIYLTDTAKPTLKAAGMGSIDRVDFFLKNYIRVNKTCGSNPIDASCLPALGKYTNIAGDEEFSYPAGYSCVITRDGALVCLDKLNTTFGNILIDINGPKHPNILGRDVYSLCYENDGKIKNTCEVGCEGIKVLDYCVVDLGKVPPVSENGYDENYWAGARVACADNGMRLPDQDTLVSILSSNVEGLPRIDYYWTTSSFGEHRGIIVNAGNPSDYGGANVSSNSYKALCLK